MLKLCEIADIKNTISHTPTLDATFYVIHCVSGKILFILVNTTPCISRESVSPKLGTS